MARLIIGNVLSLFGALLMVYLGLVKDRKRIILLQCVQCVLMGAGNFALGAYTGMVSGVTSLFRNIFSFYFQYTLPAKLGFLALQIIPRLSPTMSAGWAGCPSRPFVSLRGFSVRKTRSALNF